MIEKKEVLEYLRNRQKAAEIEAKVNGINLWVLLGAVGILGWQLLGYLHVDLWAHRDIGIRIVLIAEVLYLINWLFSPTRGIREDLRYAEFRTAEVDSPFLMLAEGVWILLPPAVHFFLLGKSFSASIIGLFGLLIAIMSVSAIVARSLGVPKNKDRFPKPNFGLSHRSDTIGDLVIGSGFVFVILAQLPSLKEIDGLPVDAVKVIALLGSLYVLMLVIIRRRRNNHSIDWTYELETDVLVGAVSPDAALRRIENRALGSRLEDVMNRFFDDLDRKLAEFENSLSGCSKGIESVKEIPSQYHVERSARLSEATADSKKRLDELLTDIEEYSAYLDTLARKRSDARVAAAMESLGARKVAYGERIEAAKRSFEALLRGASA